MDVTTTVNKWLDGTRNNYGDQGFLRKHLWVVRK